ncbi:MAG: helix-turn-helix domain-containing protein [Bacteroidetes bacterium]|nr:helix-turn-helix domain-containing protein [Bacteroidota bacterium]
MNNFGSKLRNLREENNLLLRQLAAQLDIDTALLSKIERGERKAQRELVNASSKIFQKDSKTLMVNWLTDQLLDLLANDDLAFDALKLTEQQLKNSRNQ